MEVLKMYKGPLLNDIKIKKNNQDPLGIQGISQSIVGSICPIINSVTPHAFYWVLVNWVYYDVYENRKKTDYNSQITLNHYLKIYNYFIVLGNLFHDNTINNMMGTLKIRKDMAKQKEQNYSFNEDYIQELTGINYYKAALTTAGFITSKDEKGMDLDHIHLTQKGKNLALSLDKYMKETKFYQKYASKDQFDNIPYEVIKELGKVADFHMVLLPEAKILLQDYFFNTNNMLKKQAKFMKYLYYDLSIKDIDEKKLRTFLYDNFSPRANHSPCEEELLEIVRGWEVLIARHYFTNTIEMIFKYLLETLVEPVTEEELLEIMIKKIPDRQLADIIKENVLYGNDIDYLLAKGKKKKIAQEKILENALKILCALYNRLKDRNDINQQFLKLNNYGTSISLQEFLEDMDSFKGKLSSEYLKFIISKYVIQQHLETARRKLLLGEDTFFFGYDDGILYRIENSYFSYDYQNLRINQLFSVMKELEMLGDKEYEK